MKLRKAKDKVAKESCGGVGSVPVTSVYNMFAATLIGEFIYIFFHS